MHFSYFCFKTIIFYWLFRQIKGKFYNNSINRFYSHSHRLHIMKKQHFHSILYYTISDEFIVFRHAMHINRKYAFSKIFQLVFDWFSIYFCTVKFRCNFTKKFIQIQRKKFFCLAISNEIFLKMFLIYFQLPDKSTNYVTGGVGGDELKYDVYGVVWKE